MSAYLTSIAWRTRLGKASTRLALLALADAADERGEGMLAVTDLAARINATVITAERALSELERLGAVKTRGKDRFTLTLDAAEIFQIRDVPFTPPQEPHEGPSRDFPAVTVPESDSPPQRPAQALYGGNENVSKSITGPGDLAERTGLACPDNAPFYWHRAVHQEDFNTLRRIYGDDLERIADQVRKIGAPKITRLHQLRAVFDKHARAAAP